ncbi:FMRFamide neuropeptides [Onthophagus taurus]|uniref:FMRFamide neuropeptides n=1 Tax=Onthophagus taurus TaxID=166361 RepID=UPI000C204A5F|nr:FMRFamide neuropeptides [Onthophagus taurus]XP_022912825.1 FMRFamide neuropeptides [Onthophagus taurus]
MLSHLSLCSILFFLLSTIFNAESKESYVSGRNDDRQMDSRSSRDSDRNIRRVLDNNSIRFGRRSDLPPLFNRYQYDDDEDDDIQTRTQRAGLNHLRFGKSGNNNFLRFGRNQNDTSGVDSRIQRGGNSNFFRFGRRFNDNHMRFGRTDNYMRFGRGQNFMRFGRTLSTKRSDNKRPTDNFMRFGRDYEDGDENEEEIKNDLSDDLRLAAFLNGIACKTENSNETQ